MRVAFHKEDQSYLKRRILHPGNVILIAYGGRGFYILQDGEIIEVKQWPCAGDADNIRFDWVESTEANTSYMRRK